MRTYNQALALSLIELTVTLSIIAILSGISFSTYSRLKIEHRRNEALVRLVQLRTNLQKQAISANMSVIDLLNRGVSIDSTTDSYYTYTIENIISTTTKPSYQIKATAKTDTPQSKDRECQTITLTITEGEEDNKVPVTCWGRN